jgi:hypothetical protein
MNKVILKETSATTIISGMDTTASKRSFAMTLGGKLFQQGMDKKDATTIGWAVANEAVSADGFSKKKAVETLNQYVAFEIFEHEANQKSRVHKTKAKKEKEVKPVIELSAAAKKVIADEDMTKNDKIRTLMGMDVSLSSIATHLGAQFQYVKNVKKMMQNEQIATHMAESKAIKKPMTDDAKEAFFVSVREALGLQQLSAKQLKDQHGKDTRLGTIMTKVLADMAKESKKK